MGDFPGRRTERPATEGDEGGGRKVAGSGVISARDLACNRGRQVTDGKPIRRARPPAARAPEEARQKRRSSTWELLRRATKCPWPGADRPGSPYPCASSGLARDAAAVTCLRRRNARLAGIICRRLQITADLRGLLLLRDDQAERPEQLDLAGAGCAGSMFWSRVIRPYGRSPADSSGLGGPARSARATSSSPSAARPLHRLGPRTRPAAVTLAAACEPALGGGKRRHKRHNIRTGYSAPFSRVELAIDDRRLFGRSSDALKNSPHSVTTPGPAAAAGRAAFLAIAMRTSSCSPVVTGTFAKGTAEIACAGYGLRL